MAWTLPRTWNPGETVTSTIMNTHVRDNLNVLKTEIDDDGKPPVSVLLEQGAVVASGAGETDLVTYTAPGGTLSAAGHRLRLYAFGHFAANANNKTLKLYFAGTLLATLLYTSNDKGWSAELDVVRRTAALVVERATLRAGSPAHGSTAVAADLWYTSEWDTHAPDLTAACIIKLTGTGTAVSDIYCDAGGVHLYRKLPLV